ncbi:MAG TPA: PEGA domain-containing protein [Polyangiaceae bacterium]|nr:PEGA domain-containing protein [Polyangiaceae bacterium]
MDREPTRRLVVLLALSLAMVSAQARAQGVAATPATAATESAQGDKAAKAKDYAAALTHYQAASQLAPGAHVQLGVADALYSLGRVPEAFDAYTEAQRAYGPKLAGADKTTVAARLRELTAKTGSLSVHVEDSGADVSLDGKSIGTSPVAAIVRVSVGPHEVRVTKAGYLPFVGQADIQPDGKASIDATPLAVQPTRGHVIVHAPGSEPLRVIIDGVDLGATPWEGDLPAGPHEIAGRSSNAVATTQTVNVAVGDRLTVDLVSSATAAHLQVQSSDGKGNVYVDGALKGEGSFAGDVAPGSHAIVIEREGYERFEKTVVLGERETWAENVTLKPVQAATGPAAAPTRAFEGIYGGFGFVGLFGVGGQGTDLDNNCDGLSASSCDTGQPLGGGAFGYVGWTWDPVGFELMLAASGDTLTETAHFTNTGANTTSPLALPPRDEKFTFARVGGLAALRVRASTQGGRLLRATIAGGVGLSYKKIFMERTTTTTDGTDRHDVFSPTSTDGVAYLSPAITVEGALHLRVTPTIAIAVGMVMWADNASLWGSNSTPPAAARTLVAPGQLPASIATPQYHLATGAQVFLGPFIGVQFGP